MASNGTLPEWSGSTRAAEATDTARPCLWSESPQSRDSASLADVLLPIRNALPKTLIDDSGWGRLLARGEKLPSSAADGMFGFECRLDRAEATADLLVSVLPDTPFSRTIVRSGASGAPGADSLARFISEMNRPGSLVADVVDLVALEFDIFGTDNLAAPGVFFRSVAESGYADAGSITGALALALGWREKPAERNGVGRLLAALPPGAAIRWAGGFPDRNRRAVRLLVRGLGAKSAAFASRIGWNGDASVMDRAVSAFCDCGVDNHVLALDIVDGRVSPVLGLEFSRPAGGGWGEALDMMSGAGWCLPWKAEALGRAACSERIFSLSGHSELHCGIHHIKITLPYSGNDDLPVGAKGYVACVLRPVS